MKFQSARVQWLVLSLLAAALCSCALFPRSKTRSLRCYLVSSPRLNLGFDRQPHPVVARVYLLADGEKFAATEFARLWQNDDKVLAGAVVKAQELTLWPGQRLSMTFDEVSPEARFLAVAADFINPQVAEARAILPLAGDKYFLVGFLENRIKAKPRRK